MISLPHSQRFFSGRGWYKPCYGSRVSAQPQEEEERAEDALFPQEEEEGQERKGWKEEGEDAGLISSWYIADFHNLTQILSWNSRKVQTFLSEAVSRTLPGLSEKVAPPPVCLHPRPSTRVCVCVCMHNTYCCLCIHKHTYAPQSSVHTKRASCGYFAGKVVFSLPHYKALLLLWMIGCQGTKVSCSCSISPVMAPYCLAACWYEINPGWDFILTCVEAGRVALSPDFSPWVQNMWLVTLISAGSPYSFRETLTSSSASCAFGGLLGHRQPSLCVSIESSFSPSQKTS